MLTYQGTKLVHGAEAFQQRTYVVYNDNWGNLPNVYVVVGKRIIDLSGMTSLELDFGSCLSWAGWLSSAGRSCRYAV